MARRASLMMVLACVSSVAGCGGTIDELGGDDPARGADGVPADCRGAPYPIVLSHGFAGFRRFGPVEYFFRVADDLRARGETVYTSEVSAYDSSANRARQLAPFIDHVLASTGACKVNIVAHSQGGLDARYLISTLGYGDRVGALVTVASPHCGTPIADIVTGLVPGYAQSTVDALLQAIQGATSDVGSPADLRRALGSMSPAYVTGTFNRENPDDPRVAYYSIAGRTAGHRADSICGGGLWGNPWRIDATDPVLVLPEGAIALVGGSVFDPMVNDGIVPTASSRWGRFLGCVPADHFDEIGQVGDLLPDLVSGFNHRDMYRRIVDQLHRDGR